jgi:hypothetical protein
MEISKGLKKVIFKKLYEDLSNVEIIPYEKSIWFIDRENEYWYFKLSNEGVLYWRYQFFLDYFSFFSIDDSSLFEPIISEWVEEVLNRKVVTTLYWKLMIQSSVEEVLNCKVVTTQWADRRLSKRVEEILNQQ